MSVGCVHATAEPVFRYQHAVPRDINVTQGHSVTLRCDAYDDPPANITWMKNAQPLDRLFTVSLCLTTLHQYTDCTGLKSPIPSSCVLNAPDEGVPLEFGIGARGPVCLNDGATR